MVYCIYLGCQLLNPKPHTSYLNPKIQAPPPHAQTGAECEGAYGGPFRDDPAGLKLMHWRKGLLTSANSYQPHTNTAHFAITMAAPHQLDGHQVGRLADKTVAKTECVLFR